MLRSLVLFLNMAVAVIVPLWINVKTPSTFTTGEAYLLGVGLFIALTVMETGILAERAFRKDLQLEKIWQTRTDLDARLQEVRRLFHEVEEQKVAEQDLFQSYFIKKLSDLESGLRDACSKKEVRIDETMLEVTTWLVNSAFRSRKQDVFRAIHFTADNSFFLGLHARRYFKQVLDLVNEKKAKKVRRIVIFDAEADLQDPLTTRIIQFHQATDGYSCKVMSREAHREILSDFMLQALVKDFGIYGDSYLYKGVINKPNQILGFYSRNSDEIRRFTECFDVCWGEASDPKTTPDRDMTFDRLFEADPSATGAQGLPLAAPKGPSATSARLAPPPLGAPPSTPPGTSPAPAAGGQ